MQPELLQRYDRPVPRYTSYPTAPHFHAGVTAATYEGWLGEIGEGERLSLYLHVPFCAQLCWYCGCHTKVVRRYDPIADYVASLAREMELVAAALPSRRRATQVHWGGGTPNMIAPDDFAALMALIAQRFALGPEAEVAVEIDPRTLRRETAHLLARAGVTRASLGVQDFDADVQRAINCVQPHAVTVKAVDWLHAAGIDRINFDLMYGLPHQTCDSVLRSVDLAARLEPDRIALFGYAHVPWMKKHQRLIDEAALPGAAERLNQMESAARRLVEHGYRRIGLDHFARPDDVMARALEQGRLRRNFQGYTADQAPVLLGFGASAIGALPQGYVQNEVAIGAYRAVIASGRLAVIRGLWLTEEDRLRRAVIERLMCDLDVDLEAAGAAHGFPASVFAPELALLAGMSGDGVVEVAGNRIRVTERGRPFVRSVCAAFDRRLGQGPARHSRAV